MKAVVIVGSSRKEGRTHIVAGTLARFLNCEVIDLNDFQFGYYDYEHRNEHDAYLSLATRIITDYDLFIFATPVYWYSMSGVMKVFFDRLTDLLDCRKEMARSLKGKCMAVMSSSTGDHLGDQFWLPFKATANYLKMHYVGDLHTMEEQQNDDALAKFAREISKS